MASPWIFECRIIPPNKRDYHVAENVCGNAPVFRDDQPRQAVKRVSDFARIETASNK
jgi:hypothetical protein